MFSVSLNSAKKHAYVPMYVICFVAVLEESSIK